jgi:hypothetical protein
VNDRYPVEDSLLYKKYREDVDHIHKNKWYMSERVGYDVGYERAMLNWLLYHKQRKSLKTESMYTSMMIHASASL